MKATVKKSFAGRPDNEPLSRQFREGDVIDGDLARAAIEGGFAAEMFGKPTPGSPEIAGMTVRELKAHARERDIDLGDASRKADIIAAILTAEK